VSCKLLVTLALVGTARKARAERAIHVDAAGAPFAAADLEAALRVRIPAKGAPVSIRVTAIEHGVRIESRTGFRDVPLADLHGNDAARLVALAADDLLLDDLAVPPPEPPSRAVSLGVLGGAAAWDGALGNVAVDVAVPRGSMVLAVEAGGGRMVGGALAVTAAHVRATVGVRSDWLELRAGVTAVPLFVSTGAGDVTMLVGGGVSARALLPVSSSVRAVIAAGGDVFATQTEYRVAGMAAMTTPRWAPWAALGIDVPL